MSRNRLDTACDCGLPLCQSPAGDPMTESEYAAISPAMQRYMGNQGHGWHCAYWRLITCVACGRKYAGWYSADNDLIDSSFLYAFNDEPSSRDEPEGAPSSVVEEVTRLRTRLDEERRAREAAEARLAEAVEVLRDVEWGVLVVVLSDGSKAACCPSCNNYKAHGHAPGCRLARVIREE